MNEKLGRNPELEKRESMQTPVRYRESVIVDRLKGPWGDNMPPATSKWFKLYVEAGDGSFFAVEDAVSDKIRNDVFVELCKGRQGTKFARVYLGFDVRPTRVPFEGFLAEIRAIAAPSLVVDIRNNPRGLMFEHLAGRPVE